LWGGDLKDIWCYQGSVWGRWVQPGDKSDKSPADAA
jgi:hypothetical protein